MYPFSVSGLSAVINHLLHEPYAGLLTGLLFGTKATLSRELYDALVASGTLHIIALSGMNISILAGLVSLTLLRFVSRKWASVITIALIIWFTWFVGGGPTIIRASIMGTLSLLSVVFGRQKWSLLSLALAVGIMLLVNPGWITNISFQLSALATLGIILFGGNKPTVANDVFPHGIAVDSLPARLAESKRAGPAARQPQRHPQQGDPGGWGPPARVTRGHPAIVSFLLWSLIRDDLRMTLSAQVFTIPLILYHFHRVSLVSPLANLMIGWAIAPATIFGWITALAGWVWLPLGVLPSWISWGMLRYMLWVITVTARVPFASVTW